MLRASDRAHVPNQTATAKPVGINVLNYFGRRAHRLYPHLDDVVIKYLVFSC
jgi:hypothetical protein